MKEKLTGTQELFMERCEKCAFIITEEKQLYCPRCGKRTAYGNKTLLVRSPAALFLLIGAFAVAFLSFFLDATWEKDRLLKLGFAVLALIFALIGSIITFTQKESRTNGEGMVMVAIAVFSVALIAFIVAVCYVGQYPLKLTPNSI